MSELYHQCSGLNWVTSCRKGLTCVKKDEFYSQCLDLGFSTDIDIIRSSGDSIPANPVPIQRHDLPVPADPRPISSDPPPQDEQVISFNPTNSAFPHRFGQNNVNLELPPSSVPWRFGQSNPRLVGEDQGSVMPSTATDRAEVATAIVTTRETVAASTPSQTVDQKIPFKTTISSINFTPSPPSESATSTHTGMSPGIIIAIILSVCLGSILLFAGMVVVKRRQRRIKAQKEWLESSLS